MSQKTLCIIGAGASGCAAAIQAAGYARSAGSPLRIVVLEKLPVPGKKLLATGNGKCNLLNESTDADKFSGDKNLAEAVFSVFPTQSNIAFFRDMGVLTVTEAMGRIYPMSRQASAVAQCLLSQIKRLGAELITQYKVESIKKKNGSFIINDDIKSDAVILAGGGKAAPVLGSDGSMYALARSLGIKSGAVYPALTPITLKKYDKSLKGVRNPSEISVIENERVVDYSCGELQYTQFGLSGIPTMDVSGTISAHFALSRRGRIFVSVNSVPQLTPEQFFQFMKTRRKKAPDASCEEALSGLIPKKLAVFLASCANIGQHEPLSHITDSSVAVLSEVMFSKLYEVGGVLGYEHAQVTAGGVGAGEVDYSTLEAKNHRGVFLCGELMNVTGVCGGYNLSWAFSSGRLAGLSAARKLTKES